MASLALKKLDDVLQARTASTTATIRINREDACLMEEVVHSDESVTDLFRRALRRLSQEQWEQQLRRDAVRLADEDLSTEADAW